MSETDNGFIKVYRKFFDHFLWTESREFSKAEAWVWMLKEARYRDGKNKKFIGNNLIEWKRGELPASLRFLKNAWNWGSTTKVRNYLDLLENEDMIKTRKTQGQNVISICNYSTYNPLDNEEKHSKNTEGTQREHRENTDQTQNSKKGNKGKKGKEKEYVEPDGSDEFPDVCEYLDEAEELANHLLDRIIEWKPDHKYASNKPSLSRWILDIERAIRLDGRDPENMEAVIDYTFTKNTKQASFWAKNIWSGKKLRNKYDRLVSDYKDEHKSQTNGSQQNRNSKSRADRSIETAQEIISRFRPENTN